MNLELAGRTALVTGGNTGLGRAIALALAQVGADVALTYFSNASDQTLNEIRALGRRSLALRMDAMNSAEVDRVMHKLSLRIERNPFPDPPWLQVVGILEHPWRSAGTYRLR